MKRKTSVKTLLNVDYKFSHLVKITDDEVFPFEFYFIMMTRIYLSYTSKNWKL